MAMLAAAALFWPVGAAPADDEPKAPAPLVAAGTEGFTIQSEDGSFKLRITGLVQADGRFYAADGDQSGTNTFLLRRARPIVQGTVGTFFDFNITPDFGGGQAIVQDAFLDARFAGAFRVRVGKFKAPGGLELLDSDATLAVVERGLPTDLVPNRDVGVQIHGDVAGGVVSYQAGVFDGAADGGSLDSDANDGKDLEGRVFLQPFKNTASAMLKGLAVGIAGTTGKQSGGVPSFKGVGQLTFFSYVQAVTADGTRTRLAPQASYDRGPLHLIGEWVRSQQRLRKSATDTHEARNTSWQVSASFVLTGERPDKGWVTPTRRFDPSKRAWGAVALSARHGELDVDDDLFALGYADPAKSASKAKEWGVGLDWYLTRNVKYVASYDHTTFEGGAAGGRSRKAEDAVLLRAQICF